MFQRPWKCQLVLETRGQWSKIKRRRKGRWKEKNETAISIVSFVSKNECCLLVENAENCTLRAWVTRVWRQFIAAATITIIMSGCAYVIALSNFIGGQYESVKWKIYDPPRLITRVFPLISHRKSRFCLSPTSRWLRSFCDLFRGKRKLFYLRIWIFKIKEWIFIWSWERNIGTSGGKSELHF